MGWRSSAWVAVASSSMALFAFGCGGGGSRDAGSDASDLGPDAADMGVSCSPFTPGSCPTGDRCAVLFARDLFGGTLLDVFFACVPAAGARGREAPCNGLLLSTNDITVRLTTDDCAEGLFCALDDQRIPRCMDLCDGMPGSCHEGSYCVQSSSSALFGTCEESDDCDVVYQIGCGTSEACYTAPGTNGDLLSACELPDPLPGTMAGTPCLTVSDCPRGMDCLGPDGTTEGELRCRIFCDPAAGGDAGVPGQCASGTCVLIPVDGVVQIPTAPGICR